MKMEYLMMSASFECLEISRWSAADITTGGNIWSVTGKLSSGRSSTSFYCHAA